MKNNILVYDDNCPLCCWYSALFIKTGLLPQEGRVAFSMIDNELLQKIDINKGRNEIPLIDITSGNVLYGIDALLEILGQRFPLIKTTGRIKPVYWLLKKIYKLISLNRKVIVAKKCGPAAIDCSPDINLFYRILFMFLFFIFNTAMLYPLHENLLSHISVFSVSQKNLLLAHFILIGFNCLLAFSFNKEKMINYLGQVNMLALSTILLLLPILLLFQFIAVYEWLILAYLAIVTIIIFREYIRRMEYVSVLPSNKWIASINFATMTGFILFLFF